MTSQNAGDQQIAAKGSSIPRDALASLLHRLVSDLCLLWRATQQLLVKKA